MSDILNDVFLIVAVGTTIMAGIGVFVVLGILFYIACTPIEENKEKGKKKNGKRKNN